MRTEIRPSRAEDVRRVENTHKNTLNHIVTWIIMVKKCTLLPGDGHLSVGFQNGHGKHYHRNISGGG